MKFAQLPRPRLRFGLRSVFLVFTVAAVGAGLYFAEQNRRAAAEHRLKTISKTLDALFRRDLAVLGNARGEGSRKTSGGNPDMRFGRHSWVTKILLSPRRTHWGRERIFREIGDVFAAPLTQFGLHGFVSDSDPDLQSQSWTYRDPRGEFFVVVDAQLNEGDTEAHVRTILLFHQRYSIW
jgi:hypothetical protein